jgi:hypothetical protein
VLLFLAVVAITFAAFGVWLLTIDAEVAGFGLLSLLVAGLIALLFAVEYGRVRGYRRRSALSTATSTREVMPGISTEQRPAT